MRRRDYLYVAGSTAAVAVAGCSESTDDTGDDETDSDDETTTEGTETPADDETDEQPGGTLEGDPPDWAAWIPADMFVTEGATAFALDIQTAREDFPQESYEGFQIQRFADLTGADEADMEFFFGTEIRSEEGVTAISGNFDKEAILDHMDATDEQTETVQGYEVIGGDFAVGDDAFIVGTEYQRFIEARHGTADSLGSTDSGWEELLVAVADGAFVTVSEGLLGEDSDPDLKAAVNKSGLEVIPPDSGGMRVIAHLLFDTAADAESALEEHEQTIIDEVRGDNTDQEVRSIETDGRRVVLTLESDTFEL